MSIFEAPAKSFNQWIWPMIIQGRSYAKLPDPAWQEFETMARDGIRIFGRLLPAQEARGCIFYIHGFSIHSAWDCNTSMAYRLRDEFRCHVILPDLRHHGMSQDKPPTFGTAESWDVAACLDWAEKSGLPKPFIVMGESLGGLTTQRLIVDDARVSAAICIHAPGWPWDAVAKNVVWFLNSHLSQLPAELQPFLKPLANQAVAVGNFINWAYGFDILADGDPRKHSPNLPGQPRILYVTGNEDAYEPA